MYLSKSRCGETRPVPSGLQYRTKEIWKHEESASSVLGQSCLSHFYYRAVVYYFTLRLLYTKQNCISIIQVTACLYVKGKALKEHSQLRDHTDLDISFLTLERIHPNLKSKYIQNSASIFPLFSLSFNRLVKNLFLSAVLLIL